MNNYASYYFEKNQTLEIDFVIQDKRGKYYSSRGKKVLSMLEPQVLITI